MQLRLLGLAAAVAGAIGFAPAATAIDYTAPVTFRTIADLDPSKGVVPFPNDLLLTGSTDLTLNLPVDDPADRSDPRVAMNALDGFSTTAPWSATFSAPVDPASLKGGDTVRLFEVALSGPGGGVTAIKRELASPGEFVATIAPSDPTGRTVAIVPTKALKERTSYMAVLTDGIRDAAGGNVRASLVYTLASRTTPLCSGGASTLPALPAETACALEPLRQLVNSQLGAAGGAGVPAGNVALSWVATTQSITPVLAAVQQRIAESDPVATRIAPTGMTLADLGAGLPPVADVHVGTVDLPYYLGAPEERVDGPGDCQATAEGATPCPPLSGSWQAAPGAYVAPFNTLGLDPASTHLTYANPLPVETTTQRAPLVLTVPNAASGHEKPADGWPVVIFQHGITRNRTDAFAVAGTLAAQGFAVLAIDLPLHGITDTTNPFYVGNTPFAALGATERTFDIDLQDNDTGAPGPDGVPDPSGGYFINLTSLVTSRDNLRQGVADLLALSRAVDTMQAGVDTDFDGSRVSFTGLSLGAMVGSVFMAMDPGVDVGVLSAPGGGVARLLDGSPTFGPRIRAGLEQAGVEAGTPAYDQFMVAAQTVVDSGDPINFAAANAGNRILLQEIIGNEDSPADQVIPNRVAGAPLSGTEPLIAALGLPAISHTTMDPDGVRGATRFIAGEHGSLLSPGATPLVTAEMQGEMASLVASDGTTVLVSHPQVLKPAD